MPESLHFYKFRAINKRLIESIVNKNIYAARPDDLNDPFDCQIDLERAFKLAINLAQGRKAKLIKKFYENKKFLQNWKNEISKKGIYSFSLTNSRVILEPLMWSHYAEGHRGVCLEYIIPKKFIVDNITNQDLENRLVTIGEVDYQENAFLNCILEAPQDIDKFTTEILRKYLLTKSHSWSYEKEGRLIMMKSGNIKIPNKSLRRVYYGLRTSKSDIDLVTELSRRYSGCNSFWKATKGNGDHEISTEEIIV